MEVFQLNKDEVMTTINKLNVNVKKVDEVMFRIIKKSREIYNLYVNFEQKKYLSLGDSIGNLKFQLQIIMNEKQYLHNMKKIFLEKVYQDIYGLAENIIMVVSSLDDINLEYQKNINKDNIMKQIIPIKKIDIKTFDLKNMVQLVSSIVHNLDLIKIILDMFQNFISNTVKKMKTENFHCRNLGDSLQNQRNHLIIEYNNNCQSLQQLLNYYLDLSKYMSTQVQNHRLTDFCVLNQEEFNALENTSENTSENSLENTLENTLKNTLIK